MSGSDSPIDAQQNFNFYESVHNDPLLNIEFQSGVTPKESKDRKASTSSSTSSQKAGHFKSSEKDSLRRSHSSGQLPEQTASTSGSQTAQVLDSIFNDDEELPFNSDKKKDGEPTETCEVPKCSAGLEYSLEKISSPQKGHKRSRSDIGFSVSTKNQKNLGKDRVDGHLLTPPSQDSGSTFHRKMSENIITDHNSKYVKLHMLES